MTGTRRLARKRRGLLPHVREHRNYAVVLVPVILGLGLTAQRFPDVFAGSADEVPVRLASIGLLVATILYLTSWFFGSAAELEPVERLGEDLLSYVPRSELPLIISAAVALGFLGIASVNAVAFASVLFCIKVIELWSSWPFQNLVRRNADAAEELEAGKPQLSAGLAAGVNAVRRYYLETPWVQLTTVVMLVTVGCLAVAAFSAATPDRQVYVTGTTAASLGLMAAMALQETQTWRWRMRYIRELDEAGDKDLEEDWPNDPS